MNLWTFSIVLLSVAVLSSAFQDELVPAESDDIYDDIANVGAEMLIKAGKYTAAQIAKALDKKKQCQKSCTDPNKKCKCQWFKGILPKSMRQEHKCMCKDKKSKSG